MARWTITLLTASLVLVVMGAWLQGFLPADMVGEVGLMWLMTVLPAYALGMTGGSRKWLLVCLVVLLTPFVASHHWMAVLAIEARRGRFQELPVLGVLTAVLLSWPLAVLSFGAWLGRLNRRSLQATPHRSPTNGWPAWRLPLAAACVIVFAGFQVFAFFPEYTIRRVGVWRTIEQRVRANVEEGQRIRAELGWAEKATLSADEDYTLRQRVPRVEPVTFPFASRPTRIVVMLHMPEPSFQLTSHNDWSTLFELRALRGDYLD